MADPLSYISFGPVIHDWCNMGHGMCYPVCGIVHIEDAFHYYTIIATTNITNTTPSTTVVLILLLLLLPLLHLPLLLLLLI